MILRLAKRAGRRAGAGGREVGFRSAFILFMSAIFLEQTKFFVCSRTTIACSAHWKLRRRPWSAVETVSHRSRAQSILKDIEEALLEDDDRFGPRLQISGQAR